MWRIQGIICLFLLIFALMIRFSWPEGTEMIRGMLISDELGRGAEAFWNMLQYVESGEELSDAIAVFWQDLWYE